MLSLGCKPFRGFQETVVSVLLKKIVQIQDTEKRFKGHLGLSTFDLTRFCFKHEGTLFWTIPLNARRLPASDQP